MPDAARLLKDDHRRVQKLFQRFEKKPSQETAREICRELTVHAALEEELVYPLLAAEVDKRMAREAAKEHRQAKRLIARIEKLREGDAKLEPLVSELKESVLHHVEEEEQEILPKMKQTLGKQLSAVGEEAARRREELLASMPAAAPVATAARAGGRNGARAASRDGDMDSMTREQLLQKAREAGVSGRSRMSKQELIDALSGR